MESGGVEGVPVWLPHRGYLTNSVLPSLTKICELRRGSITLRYSMHDRPTALEGQIMRELYKKYY